jgi:hypothetical protein
VNVLAVIATRKRVEQESPVRSSLLLAALSSFRRIRHRSATKNGIPPSKSGAYTYRAASDGGSGRL